MVGVVGIGHVPGIEKNWEKHLDINEIMRYVCLIWHHTLDTILNPMAWNRQQFCTPFNPPLLTVPVFFLSVAPPSRLSWVLGTVLKGAVVGILGYTCYRAGRSIGSVVLSMPTVQSLLATLRPPPAWPHCCCPSLLTTQQFSNDALITGGLKKRSWG